MELRVASKIIENIRRNLKTYIKDNNLKSLVLGVSGGIDSALVAALTEPVVKELEIPLIGMSLPCSSNKPDEIHRANDVLDLFCDEQIGFCIDDQVNSLLEATDRTRCVLNACPVDDYTSKILKGNIKARIRMQLLYDQAGAHKGMVLSTDNLTEYYLGFWTLHGDVGDYGMIQNLWKNEVYSISQLLCSRLVEDCRRTASSALLSCITAIPTDGLGITHCDLDQIMPDWRSHFINAQEGYTKVDTILQTFITNAENLVVKRMRNTEFKRKLPISITREQLLAPL